MNRSLPSIVTIKQFSTVAKVCPHEIKQVLKSKLRLPKIRFTTPIEPKSKEVTLINPRSGKVYQTKSKAFAGALVKYIAARDMVGYKREYARLWRKENRTIKKS